MPLEQARAVSINTDESFERISASDQRLEGAEMLTAATGAPSSPKTGAAIKIAARKVPAFSAGKGLRDAVASGKKKSSRKK